MNYSEITKQILFDTVGDFLQMSDDSAEELVAELGEEYEYQKVTITAGSVYVLQNATTNFVGLTINVIKHRGAEFGFSIFTRSGFDGYVVCVIKGGTITDVTEAKGSGVGYRGVTTSGNSKTIRLYRCFDYSILFENNQVDSHFVCISDFSYAYCGFNVNSINIIYLYDGQRFTAPFNQSSSTMLSNDTKISLFKVPAVQGPDNTNIYNVYISPTAFTKTNPFMCHFVLDNSVYMYARSASSYYWTIAIKLGDIGD